MTLADLCDYIQTWCHRGFAQNEVTVQINGDEESTLDTIKIEQDDNENIQLRFEGECI